MIVVEQPLAKSSSKTSLIGQNSGIKEVSVGSHILVLEFRAQNGTHGAEHQVLARPPATDAYIDKTESPWK